jgi:hypothetical protein
VEVVLTLLMEQHCSENELERERDAGALLESERNAHILAEEVVVEEVAAAGGGQGDASAFGAFHQHEVNAEAGGVADCNSCRLEQVAQHFTPRLLAHGSGETHETFAALHARMALENSFNKVGVAERRQKKLGCSRIQCAGARGGTRCQRDLVRKVDDRAMSERFCL